MAFVTLEDLSGSRELLCFHKTYEKMRLELAKDEILVICGRITSREGDTEKRVIIDRVLELDDACTALVRELHLQVRPDLEPERAEQLYEMYVAALRAELGDRRVQTGRFRAMMQIELVNDGPVTLELTTD